MGNVERNILIWLVTRIFYFRNDLINNLFNEKADVFTTQMPMRFIIYASEIKETNRLHAAIGSVIFSVNINILCLESYLLKDHEKCKNTLRK
jgi:hypothetical protein